MVVGSISTLDVHHEEETNISAFLPDLGFDGLLFFVGRVCLSMWGYARIACRLGEAPAEHRSPRTYG